MRRLFLITLVGLSFSTATLSQGKKAKKEKTEKKEAVSKEKKANKKPVEKQKSTKTEVSPSPVTAIASPATENILIFNAERGKTRGKLVVAMEKSSDFDKTPKLLGRYQVRATQRGEETEKKAPAPSSAPEAPKKPELKDIQVPKQESAPAAKDVKANKPTPAKATEKPAEKKADGDEGGEN